MKLCGDCEHRNVHGVCLGHSSRIWRGVWMAANSEANAKGCTEWHPKFRPLEEEVPELKIRIIRIGRRK